ncbi:hypothetical protein RIF29_14932 [Crotalaria pallida]|uniref:Reverse transcriptase zinc-binding domain-containing protein n=1 Tax=Crotalaria pallida TaxID=3830 RepID=A0AAN9FJ34_CROPI
MLVPLIRSPGDGAVKVRSMQHELRSLNVTTTASLKREIFKVENQLNDRSNWLDDAESISRFNFLKNKLADLLHEEETMWRQRSRALWLKNGDKNTSFFHKKANQRRETNAIKKIQRSDELRRLRWLPNQNGGKVFSPVTALDENATVSSLIDGDCHAWRIALIDSLFMSSEAQAIKSIPLSWVDREDKLVWNGTIDGELTVKSAYKEIMQHRSSQQVGSSSSSHPICWKTLWKMNIPAKIKNFLWRLMMDVLPTRYNLAKRGVVCPV